MAYINGKRIPYFPSTSGVVPPRYKDLRNYLRRTGESFNVPADVRSIGDHAFSQWYSLKEITIPEGVTSIGVCAFDGCTSLTLIDIPSTVRTVNGQAFQFCVSLRTLIIRADRLKYIGGMIVSNCRAMRDIIVTRNDRFYDVSVASDAFAGLNSPGYNYMDQDDGLYVHIWLPWSEGEVRGYPWGAPENAKFHYNTRP